MKSHAFLFFCLLQVGIAGGQNLFLIKAKVLDANTYKSLPSVVVSIKNTNITQLTDAEGIVVIEAIPQGEYLMQFNSQGYKEALIPIAVNEELILDLGTVLMETDQVANQQLSIIQLFEDELTDDNSSAESSSGLLQSSKDAFQQAAAFNWGAARFRIRGLDMENAKVMINGIAMNKLYDGRPQWSNWGGLNDATRNQEFTIGTAPSDYTFGGILGTQEINTRASLYRAGSRLTLSGANTNFNWRLMATYASGLGNDGWAYAISVGKRFAQQGYFEGITYDAKSVFLSVEKRFNESHSFNLTGIYTPNERGKNSPNTAEVSQLKGEQYNSYWGYQNGKMRNARLKTVAEPLVMLNHFFKINEENQLNSGIMYQWGGIGNSNIDYQNANSPDPAYYRKMPSYFSSMYAPDNGEFSGEFIPDSENAEKSRIAFLENPQIDWQALYRANQIPITDNNSNVIGYQPGQSHYVLYEDRSDDKTIAVNSAFNSQLTEMLSFNLGASYRNLSSHNHQKLVDLLGGAYFLDIDAFYSGSQAQSDLNNPNRQLIQGDSYGYNYKIAANTFDAFSQFKFSFNKLNFYLAQVFSSAIYQREGLFRNGIYETISFGKSQKMKFENFGFKGGVTVKISSRQTLDFNAAHLTLAPNLKSSFSNVRLNNAYVPGLQNETLNSLDASFIFRTSKIKSRLTAYYSTIKDATKISFFYAEGIFDDEAGYTNTNAFVSQTLTHLNRKNTGMEWSAEYQLNSTVRLSMAAGYGQFIFDENPNLSINNDALASPDNTNPSFDFGKALLKNYRQAGMPQQAYSMGIEYRDPKYWWIGANFNYLADQFIEVSPISRTARFYTNPASGQPFPEASEQRAAELLKQEQLDPMVLLNLIGGKSWYIKRKQLGLFFSIGNLLDSSYKTGGYEQARNANFRQLNQDISSGTPSFGNKYYYGYGRTYFLNLYYSF